MKHSQERPCEGGIGVSWKVKCWDRAGQECGSVLPHISLVRPGQYMGIRLTPHGGRRVRTGSARSSSADWSWTKALAGTRAPPSSNSSSTTRPWLPALQVAASTAPVLHHPAAGCTADGRHRRCRGAGHGNGARRCVTVLLCHACQAALLPEQTIGSESRRSRTSAGRKTS